MTEFNVNIHMYINKRGEYPRLHIIEVGYQNPSTLIRKIIGKVNRSYQVHLLKMMSCMIDTVLKNIHYQ